MPLFFSIILGVTFFHEIDYNYTRYAFSQGGYLMELIMISSSKLKIMLSADDMTKYALGSDIDYADIKTRKAFRNILSEAREKTGFDTESERIYIQLYPSKKGGCEVYITKIDDDSEYESIEFAEKSSDFKPSCKVLERSTGIIPAAKRHLPKERKRAYSFSSSESMVSVCRRLLSIGWRGQSSAFSDESRRFYIIIKDRGVQEFPHIDRLSFICEYGNVENHSALIKYLGEHGKCICKTNAIEKLGIL